MKIVIVGPVYPYRGGIAHSTTLLARALIQSPARHETRVISFSRQYPAWLYPGVSDRDPSQQPLRAAAEYLLDPLTPWSWRRAANRIIQEEPDVVILTWWTTFWGPALAALTWLLKRRRLRVVALIHNVLPHEQRPWDRALASSVLRQVDACIVLSEREQRRLHDLLPQAAVSVTHLPVFSPFAGAPAQRLTKAEARRQLGLPPDAPLLLFFGIVRPYKGLRDLLKAAAQLHAAGHPLMLLIVGEFWEPLAEYQTLIARLGLEAQVKIEPRYIPDESVGVYFSAADVFVAPYTGGTQSASVKIALAFNLPIVISRAIESAELSADPQARLHWTPPADSAALAAAILESLSAEKSHPSGEILTQPLRSEAEAGAVDAPAWEEMVSLIEAQALQSQAPQTQAPQTQAPQPRPSAAPDGHPPRVAAVVINWNRPDDTLDCLESLAHQTLGTPRLIVIDNGSSDDSVSRLRQAFPQADLIVNATNAGFTRAANQGIRHALAHGADYVLLLNNDATLAPDGLLEMLAHAADGADQTDALDPPHPVGIVAPMIYYAHPLEGEALPRIWSAGGRTSRWTLEKNDRFQDQIDPGVWPEAIEQDFVTNCAALIPRKTFERVGLLDERFTMYYEDMDFSRRVRQAGLRALVIPRAKVYHRVSASSGGKDTPRQLYTITRASVVFFRKHAAWWQSPIIFAYRLGSALKKSWRLITQHQFQALRAYWHGVWDGLAGREHPAD